VWNNGVGFLKCQLKGEVGQTLSLDLEEKRLRNFIFRTNIFLLN